MEKGNITFYTYPQPNTAGIPWTYTVSPPPPERISSQEYDGLVFLINGLAEKLDAIAARLEAIENTVTDS